MNDILTRIDGLKYKINGQEYVTPGENTLADDLLALCDIVGDVVHKLQSINRTTQAASNVASCLANGVKPD